MPYRLCFLHRGGCARLAVLGLFLGGVLPVRAQLGGLGSLGAAAQAQGVLAPGDEITVIVLRHAEFSGDYLIPASGILPLPSGGVILVAGFSPTQVAKLVSDKLKSRLLHPEVFVKLKSARVQRIYVLGDVKTSGPYELRSGWGVAESLSAAGGLAGGVEQKDVQLTLERKATGKRVTMPLAEALGKTGDDALEMQPGDVLRIEQVASFPVYITGKVKVPGMYLLRDDNPGLLAALARAGGVADDASQGNVKIVRVSGGEETVDLTPALVRGESSRLPKLKAGDMVVVSESQTRYAVMGYVGKPGSYSLPQGRTLTLSDAVAEAGGGDRRARLAKVGLLHVEDGKPIKKVYDLARYYQKGDASQNPTIRDGDVVYIPETNKVDNGVIFSGLGSAFGLFNFLRR